IVMYEMIAGERPFGDPATAAAMLAALFSTTPEPLSMRSDAPAELDAIVTKCLARKPEDRFADVADFVAALDRLIGAEDDKTSARVSSPNVLENIRSTTDRMQAQDSLTEAVEPMTLGDSHGDRTQFTPPPVFEEMPEPESGPPAVKPKPPKFIQTATLPGVAPPAKKK